jgi:thiol-disulfide isomerase/thioredoxin
MKYITLSVLVLIGLFSITYSQPVYNNEKANAVLKASYAKLQQLRSVQYDHERDIHYYTENYHHHFKAQVFFDFADTGSKHGFRFQASGDSSSTFYNGVHFFRLDHPKKNIDLQVKTSDNLLESSSHLFNSLLTIRNLLPFAIANDSIAKFHTDTLINNTHYDMVRFELPNRYFSNLGRVNSFTAPNLRRPYQLIIDRKTALPFQLIARFRRGDDEGDHIRTVFTHINTHPKEPSDLSWFYSTYTAEYLPAIAEKRKPLIEKGATAINFTLPSYTPTQADSVSLNQYKGKVVLLDFWIKTCGYCMLAFPHMNELQKQFGADKFQLLAINAEDPLEDIAFFYKKHQPAYKMLYKGDELAKAYGVFAYPITVLLDTTGKVIYAGPFDHTLLQQLLEQTLGKKDVSGAL